MEGRELKRIEYHGNPELGFDNIAFLIFSSVLASLALLSGSIPILIGAMILAPAFDPLIAVSFGLVNRDWRLCRTGFLNSLMMFAIALAICFATIWLVKNLRFSPTQGSIGIELITERLFIGWPSLITALVAGAGGALAAASNRQTNLVGVVVALALVPALAASAIAFLASPLPGWGGIALFWINYAGIIVAGYIVLAIRQMTGKAKDNSGR